jgi:hypothetical protein
MVSRLLPGAEVEKREILCLKAETMAKEIQDLNEEKLNCTLHINALIKKKNCDFQFGSELHHHRCDLTPGKFNPHPASTSTPLDPTTHEVKVPKKRGRKPKNRQELARRESVESNNLMMLADVALIKKEDEDEAARSTSFGKLPVTKHLKKNRKGRKSIKKEDDDLISSEEDSDVLGDTDENEPLYCLCNRISFGNMVECSNEACSIEWYHFGCIGMRKAPKGKWYCPKCRSRRSNVSKIKKELEA